MKSKQIAISALAMGALTLTTLAAYAKEYLLPR